MSPLTDFLYPLPPARRAPGDVIVWWERRRPAYNLIVGAAGGITVVAGTLLGLLPPGEGLPPPGAIVVGSLLYGLLANVCYTLGSITELAVYGIWGDDVRRIGPVLFRQGLVFSVGLTLFPIALFGLGWLVRLGGWLLR